MGVLLPHTEHKYPHANSATIAAGSASSDLGVIEDHLAALEGTLDHQLARLKGLIDRIYGGPQRPPTANGASTGALLRGGTIGSIDIRLATLSVLFGQLDEAVSDLSGIA